MHKVGIIALALAAAAACKNEPPPVAASPADAAPIIDPAQSYLTDEKMTRFLDSMRAEPNPFDFLFRGVSNADAGLPGAGRVEEMTAFARSYGLADADEYFRIWTLVQLATMLDLVDSVGDMGGEAGKMLEQRLQRPDLPEHERRELETQLG